MLDNDQRSYTQGVSWRRLFKNGFVTTAVSRSYQEFFFDDLDEAGVPLLSSDAEEAAWRLRSDADLRLAPGLTLGVGGGASRETVASEFFQRATPATPFPTDLTFSTDLGLWKGFGYGQITAQALDGRLALTAGVRADATDFLDETAVVSPRLSASFDLTDKLEVSAAVGRFTQSPELVSLAVQEDGASDWAFALAELGSRAAGASADGPETSRAGDPFSPWAPGRVSGLSGPGPRGDGARLHHHRIACQ